MSSFPPPQQPDGPPAPVADSLGGLGRGSVRRPGEFPPPPAGSGVTFKDSSEHIVMATAIGHYVILVDLARADGGPIEKQGDTATEAPAQIGADLNAVLTDRVMAGIFE